MRLKILIAAVLLFGAAQLVPVHRTNPPVEVEVPASDEVRALLRRSCYDCHSNESRWPWYSYVAPVSWLVVHDVNHAREHMDLSTWNAYDAEKQRKKLEDAWEEVEDGEMPLWTYLLLHPDARLDQKDKQLLKAWALGAE